MKRESDHRNRVRLRITKLGGGGLIGALLAITACAADPPAPVPEPTTVEIHRVELDPAAVVANLPWAFDVIESEPSAEADAREVLLVSTAPRSASERPPVYIRARFATREFSGPEVAAQAFDSMAAEADPDTGLSYAWDLVILEGARLHHLHGDCTLSDDLFQRMAENLRRLVLDSGAEPQSFLDCRCGGACKVS